MFLPFQARMVLEGYSDTDGNTDFRMEFIRTVPSTYRETRRLAIM